MAKQVLKVYGKRGQQQQQQQLEQRTVDEALGFPELDASSLSPTPPPRAPPPPKGKKGKAPTAAQDLNPPLRRSGRNKPSTPTPPTPPPPPKRRKTVPASPKRPAKPAKKPGVASKKPALSKKAPVNPKNKNMDDAPPSSDEDELGVEVEELETVDVQRGRHRRVPLRKDDIFDPPQDRRLRSSSAPPPPILKLKGRVVPVKKRVRIVDDEDDEGGYATDTPTKKGRSDRFARSREDGSPMDDDTKRAIEASLEVTPMRPSAKRANPGGDLEIPQLGKRSKGFDVEIDFSHFEQGRLAQEEELIIPLAARLVIEDGLKAPLPLHYFSNETIAFERSAHMLTYNGPPPASSLMFKTKEENMTMIQWSRWGSRMIAALRAYKSVPKWIPEMFATHFQLVSNKEDVETRWPMWRDYDIAARATVKFPLPADISYIIPHLKQKALDAHNDRRQTELDDMAMRRPPPPPQAGPSRVARVDSAPGPSTAASTSAPTARALKYERCILCGSRAHIFEKGKKGSKPCSQLWLVWNGERRLFCTPGGHPICFAFNSADTCRSDWCRYKQHGHACALCGSSAHGAGACSAVTG